MPEALREFRDFLARNRMYVFTINGFPYGTFHDTRVKEAVYLPDWRDPERLRYTNQLADLLAQLLPDDPAIEGSISTVPGAYKPALGGAPDVARMVEQMEKEDFGSCRNYAECEASCPKEISISFISRMNRDYLRAKLKGTGRTRTIRK